MEKEEETDRKQRLEQQRREENQKLEQLRREEKPKTQQAEEARIVRPFEPDVGKNVIKIMISLFVKSWGEGGAKFLFRLLHSRVGPKSTNCCR